MDENEKITVNDGGGLYDTPGMIDSLIVDCNEATRKLISGNAVGFCSSMANIVSKLSALKTGVEAERESKDAIIADLKRHNNDLAEKAFGIPADRENEREGET